MTLNDIMTTGVITVSMDDSLRTVREIFDRYAFHHVVVVHKGKAVGLISERDILKHLSPFIGKISERVQDTASLNKRAHQIMTRLVISAAPDTTIPNAIETMLKHDLSCLPVLNEGGRCVGIVTSRDMLRWCTACAIGPSAPVPRASAAPIGV